MRSLLLFVVALFGLSMSAHADNSGVGFYNQGNQFLQGGAGRPSDPFRAFGFFDRSARQGYGPGQFQLGLSYLQGRGVDRNYQQALHFFQLAGRQGVRGARHQIGRIYHFGFGVPRNFNSARRYYVQSINEGYGQSADTLASLHLGQVSNSVLQGSLEDLLEKHADEGDAVAQYNLAYSHYLGLNREKDLSEASSWFMKAASLGDADAQFMLGQLYMNGEGVAQNDEQCFIWSQVAKLNGHKDADQNLQACRAKLSGDVIEQALVEADSLAEVL